MTYEYLCTSCDHRFEVQAKISDPPPDCCPKCSAPGPRRQISKGTTFQLKGGGWASSGYGSAK